MAPEGVEIAPEAISVIKQKGLLSAWTLSYIQAQKYIFKQGVAKGLLVHWEITPLISGESHVCAMYGCKELVGRVTFWTQLDEGRWRQCGMAGCPGGCSLGFVFFIIFFF